MAKRKGTFFWFVGLGIILSLSMSSYVMAGNIPESEDPIKLAINEWTGQYITTHIADEILKKMGYNVEYLTAGYYPQLIAIRDNRS
nr:hypothetical protein [Bacteroidota bacterium]